MRFMECMLKIGLEYLSYHGNPTQQAMIPASLFWVVGLVGHENVELKSAWRNKLNDSTDNGNVHFS